MIRADNLSKAVHTGKEQITILHGVDLSVSEGETVAILGPSGSGKTTLLALLAGLDLPTTGRVWLNGHRIDTMNEDERAALRSDCVGFVFQHFLLLPTLTAVENVLLPLELRGMSDAQKRAMDLLDRVGLSARATHYPAQLSGGEQQRIAIARAFACRPAVLFADEPTGNLDSESGELIADLLFGLNREQGTTLVLVTHDGRLASRVARQLTLVSGHLTEALPG